MHFDPGANAPKLILVLEGARRDAQWALCAKQTLIGGRIKDRAAAERVATEVMAGLQRLSLRAADIDAVCVGIGPGSYAGLRIALAFAKGVATACRAPLVAVPSLEAMLYEPAHDPASAQEIEMPAAPHLAVMNAFAGMVFAHGRGADGSICIPTDCFEAAALLTAMAGRHDFRVVTDGPLPMQQALGRNVVRDLKAEGRDIPYGVLALGLQKLARAEHADIQSLLPDYGRASSAELKAMKGPGNVLPV